MLFNHLRVFERLLAKRSFYYVFNVVGLAVAVAGCLLVSIYVYHEFSYDAFHPDAERIYRVENMQSRSPVPLVPEIQNSVTDVESAARLIFTTSGTRAIVQDAAGNRNEENLYFVDSTFFDVFSFGLLAGDLKTALNEPQNVVITEKTARRYFNNKTDVVGQNLQFVSNFFDDNNFKVAAVIPDTPPNSQLQFDILIGFRHHGTAVNRSWDSNYVMSFVKVRPGKEAEAMDQIRKLYGTNSELTEAQLAALHLQPLTELHFSKTTSFDFAARNKKENLWILMTIGLLIVGIALVNFINISSVKSFERVKEVVVRRTLGSSQRQLVVQFLMESVLITCVSFGLGFLLVVLALPYFTTIAAIDYSYAFRLFTPYLYYLAPGAIALGLLCGWYPCYVISKFRAFSDIRSRKATGMGFRTTVVTLQFAITTFFVFGTLVVYQQMKYIQDKDLGFSKDNLLVLNVGGPGVGRGVETIRNEFSKHPSVQGVTASLTVPGDNVYSINYVVPGMDRANYGNMAILYVDDHFVNTVGIKLIAGKSFVHDIAVDTSCIIINRAAAEQLARSYGADWEDPIEKSIEQGWNVNGQWTTERTVRIIGVVEDFNFTSLHNTSGPLAMRVNPDLYYKLLVRLDQSDIAGALDHLSQKWKEAGIERPFNHQFLDDRFNLAYRKDESFESIFKIFSAISIVIGAFGLYSLVLFVVEARRKDVSIRKVLGATVPEVVIYIAKYFYRPILIGLILFLPVAFWVMNKWLDQFAYKIDVDVITFLVSTMLVLLVATITIMYKTIAVGRTNPVKYLHE